MSVSIGFRCVPTDCGWCAECRQVLWKAVITITKTNIKTGLVFVFLLGIWMRGSDIRAGNISPALGGATNTLQWRVWSWLRMNASGRPNTCKSYGIRSFGTDESGGRVRNAYATYLILRDSPGKPGLIPHGTLFSHGGIVKDLSV